MKVIFVPEALEDLTATTEYIAQDSPRAAARLADRVFAMIDRLAEGGLDGPEQVLRSGEGPKLAGAPVADLLPARRAPFRRAPDLPPSP